MIITSKRTHLHFWHGQVPGEAGRVHGRRKRLLCAPQGEWRFAAHRLRLLLPDHSQYLPVKHAHTLTPVQSGHPLKIIHVNILMLAAECATTCTKCAGSEPGTQSSAACRPTYALQ